MSKLLKITGFIPYILIVFLNAFTDLGHKIIIQNTIFKVYDGTEQIILTAIINALILLPFILLFTPSGYISDKYPKHKVMKISAFASVFLTIFILFAYYFGFFWTAFFLTFLLASKSAIYSPAKYGYIKELLGVSNIASGNAIVQSVTIVAILLGIFAYSVGFESLLGGEDTKEGILNAITPLAFGLILASLIEVYLAYKLPNKSFELSLEKFVFKKYLNGKYLKRNLRVLKTNKIIFLSIIGLSIFWAISQVVLAVFPSYIKENMAISNVIVVQGLMALSAIGIILGSLFGAKISKNYIELGMVPVASIGLFITILLIPISSSLIFSGINFFFFGVFGGMFLVPLNSLIQYHSSNKRLGLILSGNNFIQNIFMFVFLLFTVGFSLLNISSVDMFYILSLVAFCCAIYTILKLPQSLIQLFIASLFSFRYKLFVEGLSNIPQNKGVLLLGNHISWLDWAFIQIASPRQIRFVMERGIYEKKLLKPFLNIFGVIPISSGGGRKSLDDVTKYLNNGEVVCIFPEGGISRSGHLGEFKRGFELATLKAQNCVIIPFYIGGLWGTKWSRSNINFKETGKKRSKNDVFVTFGKQIDIKSSASEVKKCVFELSSLSFERYVDGFLNIDTIFLKTVKQKPNDIAIVDEGGEYSYGKVFLMAQYFKKELLKIENKNIALLLPTTTIGAVLNLATIFANKTIINLNYTDKTLFLSAIKNSSIKYIFTSRRFVVRLKESGFDILEFEDIVKFVYIEDFKKATSFFATLFNISKIAFLKFAPLSLSLKLFCSKNSKDSSLVMIFDSLNYDGVILTHRNIIANVKQISEMLNISDDETFLSSIPSYNNFGFVVTTMLPLLEGIKIVCYPHSNDTLGASKMIAKHRVTFGCFLDVYLPLYLQNEKLTPLMFESLKMIVVADKIVGENILDEFYRKFGVKIFQGFGISQTTSIFCVNIPDNLDTNYWQIQLGTKKNTVGMPIAGCSLKIVDENLSELPFGVVGNILVGGANLFDLSLKENSKLDKNFVLIGEKRWYKTTLFGELDSDGFLSIKTIWLEFDVN